MSKADVRNLKVAIAVTIIILLLLISIPAPAFSQGNQPPNIQNLIVNGGFEGGFQQDFGIGYGWGGFSNGNAVVGWNFDDWQPVVAAGKYSQSISVKDALNQDRYAGLYQTISVVPGEQYKLTIKGLIRSEEGDISLSDYGYRVQYAIDYKGGTAWELLSTSAWQELPWDEQPLTNPETQGYEFKPFETTITAQGDKLTLFIRGWKKWINNGTGLFNFDEISFVGPAPEGFQAPAAQIASTDKNQPPAEEIKAADETSAEMAEAAETSTETSTSETTTVTDTSARPSQNTQATDSSAQATTSDQSENTAQAEAAPLPVSGFGNNDSVHYVLMISISLLLVLLIGAMTATLRRRNVTE